MYKLSKLSYLFQDLEPFLETHTMGLHYYKHAYNYLNQLNSILKENNYDYRYSINELFFHITDFPIKDRENVLFNLGGVINHELYFKGISPNQGQKPSGLLKDNINKKYGSYNNF